MTGPPLGFADYLREAFHRRVRVPLLGNLPINYMALGVFGVLGIANPGFWFLGAAAELAFLFGVAGNQRFQKLIQGERLMAAREGWEEKLQGNLAALNDENRRRYFALLAQCRRILGISEASASQSLGGVRDLRAKSLNQMLGIFLRLLGSQEAIRNNLRNLNQGALKGRINEIEKRLENLDKERDAALVRSLEGTLEIQRRRLENHARADSSLQVIEAELLRIEEQVELIREESAVSGNSEHLSSRLDSVTATMAETSRWMDEHADVLSDLGGEEFPVPATDLPLLTEPPPPPPPPSRGVKTRSRVGEKE